MPTGQFLLFDAAVRELLLCDSASLESADLTACLLTNGYVPDLAGHEEFGDVSAYEASGLDYRQARVKGSAIVDATGGAAFTSDAISFGNPVSIPFVKYLLLVRGLPGALRSSSRLVGVLDLNTGGIVEALRDEFTITPSVGGWFQVTRA